MRRPTTDRHLVFGADLERLDSACALWANTAADARADCLRDAVRAAVATELTAKQREVVEAYFFEGASQGEIARRLGVSQQVVQKRLFGTSRGEKLIGGAVARLRQALLEGGEIGS